MEPLPFAVGQSPFHCKGVGYRNLCAFIEHAVPGGMPHFLAALPSDELRQFLRQPFLASSWYDVLVMIPLIHQGARELHQTTYQFVRELAGFSTKRDVGGIYRVLMHFTSPESLLERSANTAKQYFDFVLTECEALGPQHYRLRHSGIPAMLVPIYKSLVEGYVDFGLMMAGAKDVRQRWEVAAEMGSRHGLPVQRLQREVRWR
jgi:hypothetical protein